MKRDGNSGRTWSFFNDFRFFCSCFMLKHCSLIKVKLKGLLDSPCNILFGSWKAVLN